MFKSNDNFLEGVVLVSVTIEDFSSIDFLEDPLFRLPNSGTFSSSIGSLSVLFFFVSFSFFSDLSDTFAFSGFDSFLCTYDFLFLGGINNHKLIINHDNLIINILSKTNKISIY